MSQILEKRSNRALDVNGNLVNGRSADIHITTHGSDWYWTVCAIMTLSTLAFLGLAATKPRTHRIFHYITAAVTLVAAIAYFTLGANLGWVPIRVEFQRSADTVSGSSREIFYVRYIDWAITTPLLLLDLLLTAALPWPTIAFILLIDEVMIISGLIGALVESSYKWGYFVFALVALFYIWWHLIWESRVKANTLGPDVGRAFLSCGTLTSVVWLLYPISWGVSEAGNYIAPDSEAVFYGILDILAKPVFGALLIWSHRNIEPALLGIHIRDYEDDVAVHPHEKTHHGIHHGTTHGTTDGTTAAASEPVAETV